LKRTVQLLSFSLTFEGSFKERNTR